MLNDEVAKGINDQINAELYSAYLYYSMAAFFESLSLKGFCHWLRVQALEEMTHVQKFFAYLGDRGSRVLLQPIEAPPTDWESPLAVFEARTPSKLVTLDPDTGEKRAETDLTAPPVFDGLIAAKGALFVAQTDGKVVCLK